MSETQYRVCVNEMHQVDVGMAVIHLDLDERHSVLDIDSWMRFNWTDENLKWDPADYEGKDCIDRGDFL